MDCARQHSLACEHLVCLIDKCGEVVLARLCSACLADAMLHGVAIEGED